MVDGAFQPPPIPVHLAQFPTIGGLVIPVITLRHSNGQAALGVVDGDQMELCLREHRCGVCGQVMEGRMVFLMRESDLAQKCTVEPGLCPPCADYTQKACPMVAGYMEHYRQSVSPFVKRSCGDASCSCWMWVAAVESPARLGSAAEKWYALWTTQYRLVHYSDGRIVAEFSGLRVLAIREISRQR